MVIHGGLSDLLVRSSRLRRAVVVPGSATHGNAHPVTCNRFQRQRGAYAVEFALVFPLFFLVVYATLTYGLIFTAQQSLNYAAESGARAALSWPASSGPEGRADAALAVAENISGWIDTLGGGSLLAIGVCDGVGTVLAKTNSFSDCGPVSSAAQGSSQIGVVLRYPYAKAPLVPLLGPGSLMGFAVPDALMAAAQVNLKIAYGTSDGS